MQPFFLPATHRSACMPCVGLKSQQGFICFSRPRRGETFTSPFPAVWPDHTPLFLTLSL